MFSVQLFPQVCMLFRDSKYTARLLAEQADKYIH